MQAPIQGLKIDKVYGEMWNKFLDENSYIITMNHLISGVTKDFILELKIPKLNL